MALGAPLLFFAVVELALRVAGFGRNPDFFIPDERPGWYRSNPRFTGAFFPASFGLKPVNFRLPQAKPAGTRRIFVIGESAAMGVPEPAFGLAPQLEAQLRSLNSGQKVEVFNLGMTAINSHAILPVVKQALDFSPDLLVIYMGNNEVVGPYGSSSVVTGGPLPRPLIRAGLWARGTRTGQLVQRVLARFASRKEFRDWRGMEMFAGKAVAANDPGLVRVRANFAANLDDMLAAARSAGVKVVLSTVAVNLRDCSPFVSRRDPALPAATATAWQAAWEEGRALAAAGEYERARPALARAVALDPGHADGHFLLAACDTALLDAGSARRDYLVALEADALRFRADAAINAIIRAAATTGGVLFVDAARELGSDPTSAKPPPGADLFFEHVHFNWEGNYALARLMAPTVATALFGSSAAPRIWLDEEGVATGTGYTPFARLALLRTMDELTGRPPFTGQWRYAADRTRLARQIAAAEEKLGKAGATARAGESIATALAADPHNPRLLFQGASVALQTGDAATALARLDQLAAEQPFSAEQGTLRAGVLLALGRTADAEEALRRSIAAEPYYFQSYGLLAKLQVDAGRLEEAAAYLASLVERMPDSRLLRSTWAQLLARGGDVAGAERELRTVLTLVPDDESALAPLVQRLAATHREAEALAFMQAAHAYNPRSFANNQRLVEFYDARGATAETVAAMADLAESGPVNSLLFRDLALNLRKLGRRADADLALLRGRRAAIAENDAAARADFERLLSQP